MLDILLAQPAYRRIHRAQAVARVRVARSPIEDACKRSPQQFRAAARNIRAALRALLLQPEVIARDQDNALVKSPAELVVGFVRQSGGES